MRFLDGGAGRLDTVTASPDIVVVNQIDVASASAIPHVATIVGANIQEGSQWNKIFSNDWG